MVEAQDIQNELVKFHDGKYQLVSEPIEQPGPGKVLIKVAFSTCNPVDRYRFHLIQVEGAVLGTDGSGVIVQVGEGENPELIGKKVSFVGSAFCKYRLDEVKNLLILDDSQDLSKAANAWVNPFTAFGQLDAVQKKGSKASIINAAASQLGQQFIKLSNHNGLEVISIVRKEEHVRLLKEQLQQKYVLNQTSETFLNDLSKMIGELNPLVFFEYTGGSISAKVFERMAPTSEMIIVGKLSEEAIPINSADILFNDKHVNGFYLSRYLPSRSLEVALAQNEMVSNDLRDGGKIFGTTTVKTVELKDWYSTITDGAALATDGKFLIKCA